MMRTLVLGALALGCKDTTSTSTSTSTPPAQARLLRYRSVPQRYQVVATAGTPKGSLVPVDIARTIELDVSSEGDRHLRVELSAHEPLAAYDVGELLGGAVLMFPELPVQEVAHGQRWTVSRSVRVAGSERPIDLSHELTYVADRACPSGAKQCAMLELTSAAKTALVRIENATWMITYSASGTIYVDVERGAIDESRLRANALVANGPTSVSTFASAVATPLRNRR